jgi:hypothetical protein
MGECVYHYYLMIPRSNIFHTHWWTHHINACIGILESHWLIRVSGYRVHVYDNVEAGDSLNTPPDPSQE